MKRKLTMMGLVAILIILSTSTISNAISVNQQPIKKVLSNEAASDEVCLGSASIVGDGNSSTLEAVVKKDVLRIGLDSESSYVDFYIDYDMDCGGTADEGIITLTISINGQNITPTIVQTQTSKSGTLTIENIEIHRQDTLVFVINVVYGSVVPLYGNSTSANGVGVFSKSKTIGEKLADPFLDFLEKHSSIFSVLRYLLGL